MQIPELLTRQANCPLPCPQDLKVGNDITSKVKIKSDHVRKDGSCAIYIQCFYKGEQIRIPTAIAVAPKYWNKKTQRLKRNHPNATDYNLIIEDMLSRIHELRVKARLGHLTINAAVIREFITESSLSVDFLAYMEWKIKQRISEIAYNTYRQHRSALNTLRRWKSTIPFSQINDNLFFSYKKALAAYGLGQNTIANKIKIVKIYLNAARADGMHFTFPERSLKVSETKGKKEALSHAELKKAINLYHEGYLNSNEQQTLRCFLFSCFTGLRYGDIKALKPDQIVGKYLMVLPEKTKRNGKYIKIPINQMAEQFLDRQSPYPLGKVISNQKMNQHLKKIAAFLGTNVNLSYHVSRHTFATIFLELGGAVEVLQKLLGHSKLELTMIYAHIADRRKEDEMSNFDKLLD